MAVSGQVADNGLAEAATVAASEAVRAAAARYWILYWKLLTAIPFYLWSQDFGKKVFRYEYDAPKAKMKATRQRGTTTLFLVSAVQV